MDQGDWHALVASAIRQELEEGRRTPAARSSFVTRLTRVDPALNDPRNISDTSLNAAWNFADSYFSALEHGFDDVDGLPIEEARELLVETARRLEHHQAILDPHVLRYVWPRRRS